MGTENHDTVIRHLVEFVDEHGTACAQVLDHKLVVHYLVAHVDRCPEAVQRTLDNLDRAVDAGAEAPWVG